MIKKLLLFGVVILLSASCSANRPDSGFTPGVGLEGTPAPGTTPKSSGGQATLQIPVTSGSTSTPQVTPSDLPPDCLKSAATPMELNRCAELNAHRAVLKMEQLAEAVKNTLSGEQLDEFKTLQSRWEALTASLCGWEVGNLQDSSLNGRVYSTCAEQQYLDRIQELKLLLCPDRGLSGPCPASNPY